jgi:hypothetical protein
MRKLVVLITVLLIGAMTLSIGSAAPSADPNCPASYVSQLAPGVTGHVNVVFSTLRYTPDGNVKQVIFAPGTFSVQTQDQTFADTGLNQGPCVTNTRWWYVQYMDVEGYPYGWALESEIDGQYGSAYWMVPGLIETPTSCSNSPTFGLIPGGTGEIAQDFSTLRPAPGEPGTVINAPASFWVVDPMDPSFPAPYTQPTCAGGLAFWYINYGGTIGAGWASEGQGSTRWLQNTTPEATPEPTVEPTPEVTAAAAG